MGKKRTPEELAKKARENGFDDDMTGIDDAKISRPITSYTDGLYARRWSMWLEYVPSPHPRPRNLLRNMC